MVNASASRSNMLHCTLYCFQMAFYFFSVVSSTVEVSKVAEGEKTRQKQDVERKRWGESQQLTDCHGPVIHRGADVIRQTQSQGLSAVVGA